MLWGIGKHRLNEVVQAVKSGLVSAPIDLRYLAEGPHSKPEPKRGEICTFLELIYESVAETLPDVEDTLDNGSVAGSFVTDVSCPTDPWVVSAGAAPAQSDRDEVEVRYLPKGSLHDYFIQMQATESEDISFRHFYRVYKEDFAVKLKFREERQHKTCSTCVKHKLILRHLANNTSARLEQARHYRRHLARQYADRRMYWSDRGASRNGYAIRHLDVVGTICLIMDGVDQVKCRIIWGYAL
jgi:hypothetical protein